MYQSIWEVKSWKTPASLYPRRKVGRAAVTSCIYEPGLYYLYCAPTPDGRRHQYFEALKPLRVTCLKIDGKVWMVDDPPHYQTMLHHATRFKGHVLCAGLGLGLMVHTLTARDEVDKITVIEREQDVIDLIVPSLPTQKLTVIKADWYSYTHAGPVDGVLNDLFVGNAFELMDEAARDLTEMRLKYPGAVHLIHGFSMKMVEALVDCDQNAG